MGVLSLEADPGGSIDPAGVEPSGGIVEERFVIRLFVETPSADLDKSRWHGQIEDVFARTPYTVRNPESLTDFLVGRLERLGVVPGWLFRWRRRLGCVHPLEPVSPRGEDQGATARGDRT
jgi:hypothetical protein